MRRIILLLLILLFAAGAARGETVMDEESADLPRRVTPHAQLDNRIDALLEKRRCTGGALLVAKNGVLVYEHYYGCADLANEKPVTADTYFRTASVSKMITAIGIMTLVEDGTLDLDADLSDYFGYQVRNTYYPKLPITLRMVMSHTSTITDRGGYSNGTTSLRAMLDVNNRRKGNFLDKKPGTAYIYANMNGGILGALMEAVTDQLIEDCMRERVFDPLQLKCTYRIARVKDPENISNIYDDQHHLQESAAEQLNLTYTETPDPDRHFRTTAGRVWGTGMDLLKLGVLLEQKGTLNSISILRAETVSLMMADQKGKGGITARSFYGLNINRNDTLLKGRMVYGHQGMSGSILSNVYFEPESGLVFAFVCNGISNYLDNRVAGVSRDLFGYVWDEFGE